MPVETGNDAQQLNRHSCGASGAGGVCYRLLSIYTSYRYMPIRYRYACSRHPSLYESKITYQEHLVMPHKKIFSRNKIFTVTGANAAKLLFTTKVTKPQRYKLTRDSFQKVFAARGTPIRSPSYRCQIPPSAPPSPSPFDPPSHPCHANRSNA